MDMYPKYVPWVYVTYHLIGAKENGKLSIDLPCDGAASFFADVIGAVIRPTQHARARLLVLLHALESLFKLRDQRSFAGLEILGGLYLGTLAYAGSLQWENPLNIEMVVTLCEDSVPVAEG